MNCDEEMREKKEMGERGCVCGGGQEKRKAGGNMGGGGKKKGKKKWGVGFTCMVGKKGECKRKKKKILKLKNLN